MKRLLLLGIAASIMAGAPARAQQVDLKTITCKKFFEYNKDNFTLMLTWLDAFYKEDDADPIIDFEKMGQNGKKLGEYCARNSEHSIITAADKVWGKDKK